MRKLPSWVDGFYEYTATLPSPSLYRKWAGIATVAGALERRVYTRSVFGQTFPGMYTVLVGPPGVGKTVLTSIIYDLWATLSDGTNSGHHIAPSSVTKAALIDSLFDAERKIVNPKADPPVSTFNSLKVCSNELSTLVPAYDGDFMGTLTDLWDGKPYSERRRTKDHNIYIEKPQLNIIAGTTPAFLTSMLPETAWDGGFLSRTVLIFSSEVVRRPLFDLNKTDNPLWDKLVRDLKEIGELEGTFTFESDASKCLSDWHMEGGPPLPEHPKLMHYSTRRTYHLFKLCMVASASRANDLLITLDDVQQALDWLIEAETFMPDIFKSMSAGGDARAIEDTWYFTYQIYMKEGSPVVEHRIINFLQERVPAHSVDRVLEVMVRAQILSKSGGRYTPRPPKNV